jgi:hypothetical protein
MMRPGLIIEYYNFGRFFVRLLDPGPLTENQRVNPDTLAELNSNFAYLVNITARMATATLLMLMLICVMP